MSNEVMEGPVQLGGPSKEMLIDHILWNVESMAFPPSQEEAEAFAEVLTLPRVTVTRPPRDYLLKMGMIAYNCHVNCSEYAASDPSGLSKHVWGWIIFRTDLILHSVVEREGLWRCLTPQHIDVPEHFTFIPDPAIEWRDTADGSARDPYRKGQAIPSALRKHPEDHIQMRDRFHELIAAGMSVFEARDQVASTLEVEFSRKTLLASATMKGWAPGSGVRQLFKSNFRGRNLTRTTSGWLNVLVRAITSSRCKYRCFRRSISRIVHGSSGCRTTFPRITYTGTPRLTVPQSPRSKHPSGRRSSWSR